MSIISFRNRRNVIKIPADVFPALPGRGNCQQRVLDTDMIAYDLKCANGHTFEGWFKDAKAFDGQIRNRLVACPFCNDTAVSRLPSTFAIKTSHGDGGGAAPLLEAEKLGEKIVAYVEQNFDNVGADFAKEALKIHYGVSEPRNIRGVSTDQEETLLRDEGIAYFKIPLPERADSDA
jgi:hypothetical protein